MNNQAIEYLETALQNSNPTALDNDTVRFLRINIEKALQALQPATVKPEQDDAKRAALNFINKCSDKDGNFHSCGYSAAADWLEENFETIKRALADQKGD